MVSKITDMLQTTFSNALMFYFAPKGPLDTESVLVPVMAWRWSGEKRLPEPRLSKHGVTWLQLESETYQTTTYLRIHNNQGHSIQNVSVRGNVHSGLDQA